MMRRQHWYPPLPAGVTLVSVAGRNERVSPVRHGPSAWFSSGKLVLPLVLNGVEIPEGGVPPVEVVPSFDVLEDRPPAVGEVSQR